MEHFTKADEYWHGTMKLMYGLGLEGTHRNRSRDWSTRNELQVLNSTGN